MWHFFLRQKKITDGLIFFFKYLCASWFSKKKNWSPESKIMCTLNVSKNIEDNSVYSVFHGKVYTCEATDGVT